MEVVGCFVYWRIVSFICFESVASALQSQERDDVHIILINIEKKLAMMINEHIRAKQIYVYPIYFLLLPAS